MKTPLDQIQCYIFDMDGTLYLGEALIDGTKELIDFLRQKGIRFFFFTNNSSKDPIEYVKKLTRLGIEGVLEKDILTSGQVMLAYIKGKYKNIYLAGTPALERQFEKAGYSLLGLDAKKADAAILGFDTTFHFGKADTLCRLIANGADFLATNVDRICPLEGGAFWPDCGSMAKMIEHATGVAPKFVGKPYQETVDYILAKAKVAPHQLAMVGDRLYTDIATAVNGGCVGIAVLSGEISQKDIDQSEIKPDYTFNSVKEILGALQ